MAMLLSLSLTSYSCCIISSLGSSKEIVLRWDILTLLVGVGARMLVLPGPVFPSAINTGGNSVVCWTGLTILNLSSNLGGFGVENA
jgi:hypothetical protein